MNHTQQAARTYIHTVLLAVLAAALFLGVLATSGCSATGGQMIVGYATLRGDGDVRTDLDHLLVLGEIEGHAGIFIQGSGFPLTAPLSSKKDTWVALVRKTKEKTTGQLGVDPLPAWAVTLYRPGELAQIAHRLGFPEGLAVEGEVPPPSP